MQQTCPGSPAPKQLPHSVLISGCSSMFSISSLVFSVPPNCSRASYKNDDGSVSEVSTSKTEGTGRGINSAHLGVAHFRVHRSWWKGCFLVSNLKKDRHFEMHQDSLPTKIQYDRTHHLFPGELSWSLYYWSLIDGRHCHPWRPDLPKNSQAFETRDSKIHSSIGA